MYFLRLYIEVFVIAKYHPDKHVNAAIEYAIKNGWTYIERKGKGHAKGILRCGSDSKCHQKSVWSTPEPAENHAKSIVQLVDKCKK